MLHPKNQIQKDRLLSAPLWLCMERAKYFTEVYKETEGEHPSIRAAKALQRTFKNMVIMIYPEELLVGNRSSKHIAPPIPCERGEFSVVFKYRLGDLKKFGYHISPEHEKILFKEIIPYWENKSVRYYKLNLFKEHQLDSKIKLSIGELRNKLRSFKGAGLFGRLNEDTGIINNNGRFKDKLKKIGGSIKLIFKLPKFLPAMKSGTADNVKGRGRCTDAQAHIVVGYKNVLKFGFKGIKAKATERKKSAENEAEKDFLTGIEIVCDSIKDFSLRFSDLTIKLAETETDLERKKELIEISKICQKVPWEPAQTFHEAMQSMWFTQNAIIISYGSGSGITPGRVDQLLYPYYKKDVENGRITREQALRLVEEFIIKINNNVIIWPNLFGTSLNHLGSDVENITIGGIGRDGEDSTNELSFIFIDAIGNAKLATSSSFRYSKKSPSEYLRKVVELHKHTSGAAFFNDEIAIPLMMNDGYTLEAARDYCLVGCIEPSGNGDTYGATGGTKFYLPTILDMVFNRGKTTFFGNQDGPDTGDPVSFKSFEEFMDAFYIQMNFVIQCCAKAGDLRDEIWAERFSNPLISSTIDDCIENARDANNGGANYLFQAIGAAGVGTTVDSLAAIKKFVFEEKAVSISELIDAIRKNFHKKESLRQILKKGPKYGNDDDYVDSIAVELVDRVCESVKNHKLSLGGHFKASFSSYGLNIYEGIMEPATPNGRKAAEPISNAISPCNGAEKNGPTAAIKSIAKIDHIKAGYGDSFNMKMPKSLLETEKGIESFENLIKTYFDLGGFHIQFNVINEETLRDAQIHPEQYEDLIVRVSGYSAYFTQLGKSIQDDLIQRITFTTLY
ncbi:MAG: hypothetical protein EAX96_07855 [Candidatus Lokiarchaeota archaeon]|nr:hypothetical protein [Candidatus Lokiarchaeota archaeon]